MTFVDRGDVEDLLGEAEINIQSAVKEDSRFNDAVYLSRKVIEDVFHKGVDTERVADYLEGDYSDVIAEFLRDGDYVGYTEGNYHHIPRVYLISRVFSGNIVIDVCISY